MTDPAQIEVLRQSSRSMVRELGFTRPTFGASGLTHARCHALIEISRAESMGVLDLAQALRIDKASASRIAKGLVEEGLIRVSNDGADARRRMLSLSADGKRAVAKIDREANARVEKALSLLEPEERGRVLDGIALYAKALERARLAEQLVIRPIRRGDDPTVAEIIRTVMTTFDATGAGYAIHDAEVDSMTAAYSGEGAAYFVVTDGSRVLGGGGFGPLSGSDGKTCELRKMYFLPEVRGLGVGRALLEKCLGEAKRAGYANCYLETLERMTAARRLYEKAGFRPVSRPLGNTGHFGCDAWYAKPLQGA